MEPLAQLVPGLPVTVYLANNRTHRGQVVAMAGGWLELAGGQTRLVNLAQVVEILIDGAAEGDDGGSALPRPRSKDTPVKAGSRAPGRPWADEDLQALAHGFLDGVTDSVLAERFNRTRPQVTILHQGFECARGNLTDDAIPPAARTWVDRWRKVLAG